MTQDLIKTKVFKKRVPLSLRILQYSLTTDIFTIFTILLSLLFVFNFFKIASGSCVQHKQLSSAFSLQELLSLAKRKRVDSGEHEEPVNKPAASTDSETSDSDDEVRQPDPTEWTRTRSLPAVKI